MLHYRSCQAAAVSHHHHQYQEERTSGTLTSDSELEIVKVSLILGDTVTQ